jgi:hypothetical protein
MSATRNLTFTSRFSRVDLLLFVILFGCSMIYWPGLSGGLFLDDMENLRPLEQLDQDPHSWQEIVTNNTSGPLGRPVAMLSFVANYLIAGPSPWSFKLTNLLIHLVCGIFIYLISKRLLRIINRDGQTSQWIALYIATSWLLSPLLLSTVLYTVQRMTQLSALFVFIGLYCYISGRQLAPGKQKMAIVLVASAFLVWMPLAALSKENGALLPLLALLVEVYFFRFAGTPMVRRLLTGIYFLFLAIPALAIGLKLILDPHWLVNSYASRDFTLLQRVLTEGRILFTYLSNLVIPRGSQLGLHHDDYLVSTGLTSPGTTRLALSAWIAVLAGAVLTYRKAVGIVLFGIVFFLAGHAMESTIFALELYFEHRNYLPGFGIYFSCGVLLNYAIQFHPRLKRLILPAFVLLPVLYGVGTLNRSLVWQSWDTILLTSSQSHPDSPRLQADLALYHADKGDARAAIKALDKLVALQPSAASGALLSQILVHCLTNTTPPDDLYQRMNAHSSIDNHNYVLSTFKEITGLIQAGQCNQLDTARFAAIMDQWIGKQDTGGNRAWRWVVMIHLAKIYADTLDDLGSAIMYLDRSAALLPQKPEPAILKIKYAIKFGELERARHFLARLKASHPHPADFAAKEIRQLDRFLETAKQTAAGTSM